MTRKDRLLADLRRAYAGEAWHGPALAVLLRDVDAATAAAPPAVGAHSIWEIVLHLTGWVREVARRLEGRPAQLPEGGDWTAVGDTSASAWEAARKALAEAHGELVGVLANLADSRLDEPLPTSSPTEERVTAELTLSGVLQHDAYHGGQIALLKKARR